MKSHLLSTFRKSKSNINSLDIKNFVALQCEKGKKTKIIDGGDKVVALSIEMFERIGWKIYGHKHPLFHSLKRNKFPGRLVCYRQITYFRWNSIKKNIEQNFRINTSTIYLLQQVNFIVVNKDLLQQEIL